LEANKHGIQYLMKQFAKYFLFCLVLTGTHSFAYSDENEVHCLSKLVQGVQWKVATQTSRQDPKKVTVSVSRTKNGIESPVLLVFTGLKEDTNTGFEGFDVSNPSLQDPNGVETYPWTYFSNFELVNRGASLHSKTPQGNIDLDDLACSYQNDDQWTFSGFARTVGPASPEHFCGNFLPPSQSIAEAGADAQAASFCMGLGLKSVRAGPFQYETNFCAWGGPMYSVPSDTIYATGTYRCE